MSKLRIHVLGGLQVFSGPDRAIAIPTRKAQALLAYLARYPGRPQSRDKLASLFWEGRSDVQARTSLRQTLKVLRKALPLAGNDLVAGPGGAIMLMPDGVRVDATEFEGFTDRGTPEDLKQAVALYQGEFLEAFNPKAPAFEDWLMAERQRLRERAVDAMSGLLARHMATGASVRAIELAVRLLSLDPLQEPVHRTLMQLYARQGRIGAALRQFHICREMLQEQLGVRPEPETEQLFKDFQRKRQGRNQPVPAAADTQQESVETNSLDATPRPDPITGVSETPGSELRQVTILFAEMADVTRIGDDLERVQRRTDGFVATVREVVERYGGTIDRDFGGNVMALFGIPVAHTDDAERAVRAALEIRVALGSLRNGGERPLGVRIGVADGRVLITRFGQSVGRTVTITGEVVSVAAALTAAADTDELLVSGSTYQALSHLVDGAEPRNVACRELDKLLRVWRVRALHDRPSAAARVRFVGRRAELRQVSGALEACQETGRGLTIYVTGEAGIGKTRLVEEFNELASGQRFVCHTGLVLDFGAGKGQNAIRAIVQGLMGLSPEEETRDQAAIERAVTEGLIDRDRRIHLYDLLQHPLPRALRALYDAMDNATRERGRQETLAELLRAASSRQSRLIVIEDVHWADPPVLTLAAALAATVAECPAMLVMTARPEGDPLSPAWHGMAAGGPQVTMHLGPLHREDMIALVTEVADPGDPFAMRCIERSGGNPLFLEQLLRNGPAGSAGLPGSVQSVMLARMDKLHEHDRYALRAASVLGQRFSTTALCHLTGMPEYECGGLLKQGLVRPDGDDYLFAHALVQEGAYSSLPKSERRELHRRAAEWFADKDSTVRAEHLDRAEDPAAPRAYLEAARSQASEYRNDRALRLVERGLALGEGMAEQFALTCCRGEILHDLGVIGDARAAYEAAFALARDDGERCRAWLGLAAVKRITVDLDGALADVQQAEEAAERLGPTEEAARAHILHGNLLFLRGDLEGCLSEHQRGLELARQAGSIELEATALGGLGDAEYMRGRMLTAHDRTRRCVELSQQSGFGRIVVANRPLVAITLWYAGDTAGALQEVLAAIDAAAKVGHRRGEMQAHYVAYVCRHSLMEFDAALDHIEMSLKLARQLGAPPFEAVALARRGELHRSVGRRAEALADLNYALAISRKTGLTFVGPWILGLLAVAAEDAAVRHDALAEGEALLTANSIAHNHLNFRREAIDACLADRKWAGAIHHAAALEDFTCCEPLPWATFFVARARALAAYGEGRRSGALTAELQRLKGEGERLGFRVALPAIKVALDPCNTLS